MLNIAYDIILLSFVSFHSVFTESTNGFVEDPEKQLKCDACIIVAYQMGKSFVAYETKHQVPLKNENIIESLEATCDSPWAGYHSIDSKGVQRLSGPGALISQVENKEIDSLWQQRLQDLCDEYLTELQDEKVFYEMWRKDTSALEGLLCRGDGIFSACASDDWGAWPGEDYDDYEDDSDDDYFHDEF